MMFVCDRCGYSSSRKPNLKRHCLAKTSCKPNCSDILQKDVYNKYFMVTNQFKCDAIACNKYLISNRIRYEHHKRCKHIAAEREERIKEPAISIANNVAASIINNGHNIMNNSNNTMTNSNNVTNNITINAFGHENSDHICDDLKFMRECVSMRKYGFLQYIDRKYFDLAHPENMTINKPTKKDALVRCSTGNEGGFTTKLLSDVTTAIIDGYGMDVSGFLQMDEYRNRNKDQSKIKPSTLVRHFMVDVGGPLEIDISPFDVKSGYDESKWTEKHREKKKKDLHMLMHTRLYENSVKSFRPAEALASIAAANAVVREIPASMYDPDSDLEDAVVVNSGRKNTEAII